MKNTLKSVSMSIDGQKTHLLLALSLLLWSLITPALMLNIVNAQDQASMLVDPSLMIDHNLDSGSNFTVTITVSDVMDLFRWQAKLWFNSSLIECSVAYLPADRVFDGERIVPVALEIDNTEGSVLFSISLSKYSSDTVDVEDGVLCALNFEVLSRGSCQLTLDSVNSFLINGNSEKIPTSLIDGFFDNRNNGHISQDGATMFVHPASIVDTLLIPSSNFTIFINVSDVTSLFTWQSKLWFDPSIIECTGAYYPAGHVFEGETFIPVEPTIDNTGGSVLYGCSLLMEPVDAPQGVLCALEFHVLDVGSCSLSLDQESSFLLDYDVNDIPTTLEDGFFDNREVVEVHDVAVTNVVPSSTSVTIGDSVTINVTVENEGDFAETFDVTAYYDGTVIDTITSVSLNSGESNVLPFTWDTTGVTVGIYVIGANATVVPDEEDVSDNYLEDGTVEVVEAPPPHDIAVTDVSPSPTSVTVGDTVTIDVTVENQGTETETFNITAYYDQTIIDTTTTSLDAGESNVLSFTWNTTGVVVGNYVISANATVVAGEEDTVDNFYEDGTVEVVEMPPPIGAGMFVDPGSIVNSTLGPSNNFTVTVGVSNVTNLFAWQSELWFNASILECTDAYLPAGHVFDGLTVVPVTPQIDNTLGSVLYGSSLLTEAVDVDQGVLCALEFHVLDRGRCDLTLDQENSFHLDFDLNIIPTALADGFFDNREIVEMPSILSCDSEGAQKDIFVPEERVYACGEDYDPEESVTIYVVLKGGPYTSDVSILSVPAKANASGILGPVDLGAFQPGEYDIWIDRNGNEVLDEEREPVDTFGATAGFFVIPEYFIGTILGLAGCFAAFGTFFILRRKR
jgi:hypothetical protein